MGACTWHPHFRKSGQEAASSIRPHWGKRCLLFGTEAAKGRAVHSRSKWDIKSRPLALPGQLREGLADLLGLLCSLSCIVRKKCLAG